MGSDRESVGIYGKLPSQGDFVRLNASDPAAQSLDQWVQESLETLARTSLELPPEALFFCHQAPHPSLPALIGALAPSQDQVGRRYPMLVFARVDAAVASSRFPALHIAYGHFLLDAARILGDLGRADASLMAAWARSLRVPTPAVFAHTDFVCRHVLDQSTAADLHARVFGHAPPLPGALGYALKTAADACDATRARPLKVPITLECPLGSDLDAFTWLELVRRRLYGTPVRPSFVWREGADPRLLVALGPAPGTMLRQLLRQGDTASTLWPLTTTRPDAIGPLWATMAPHHRQALEHPALPLEHLLAAFAR